MGQKYTEEYKADVLKLADEIGVGAACQQLGISTKTVYNWRRARGDWPEVRFVAYSRVKHRNRQSHG